MHIRADDPNIETLAMGAGLDEDRIAKRAKAEDWAWMRARYRERMGLPQENDILDRWRADWDRKCREAFAMLEDYRTVQLKVDHVTGSK
jgi:hypothetical protein